MFWRRVKDAKFHSSRGFMESCSGFQKCIVGLWVRCEAQCIALNYSEILPGLNLGEKLVASKNHV